MSFVSHMPTFIKKIIKVRSWQDFTDINKEGGTSEYDIKYAMKKTLILYTKNHMIFGISSE